MGNTPIASFLIWHKTIWWWNYRPGALGNVEYPLITRSEAIEKGAFGPPSTTVVNFTFFYCLPRYSRFSIFYRISDFIDLALNILQFFFLVCLIKFLWISLIYIDSQGTLHLALALLVSTQLQLQSFYIQNSMYVLRMCLEFVSYSYPILIVYITYSN